MGYDTDVVIIGAGPVGLTLANLLGLRGIDVVLLEAGHELIDYPRAVGIDDEAMRVMQGIGLVEKVLPHTVPDQQIRMVNGRGKVIGVIDPTTRVFGWPRRNGFVQPLVDRVLLDGLDRFANVRVQFDTRMTELRQDGEGVTVQYSAPGGQERAVRAKWVVAADGGSSGTRKALGISFEGETRKTPGLVIDVANDPIGTPHAVFGGDPKRGWATLSLPHGIRRWEFNVLPGEEDRAETDAFVHEMLAEHVPDPSALNIIRRRVYTFNARIAGTFRKGRVLLAGDAAHVMPVVAGQGWNSGIRDAVNLGWKLAAVVDDRADATLLDTYDQERRDHVAAMIGLSLNMSRLMTNRSRLASAARDLSAAVISKLPKLKAQVSSQGFKPMPQYERGVVVPSSLPRSKSVPVSADSPLSVGTLFPQPRVRTADGAEKLLDDATGTDWRVIVWNNDPAALLRPSTAELLPALGATLVHIVPAAQLPWASAQAAAGVTVVGDPAGEVKRWFDGRPFSALVVRPDHVIAAECLAQELDETLQKVLTAARVIRPAAAELGLAADAARLAELATDPEAAPVG
ncbi:bifunctional 3-(3-hydroxy-phenyl)propionate/3-hydroxycinnamic acid hydroxylase [Sinomonas atrocyanea]|uniref:bifunctional 3-(3-hydroxy-phenyl)propionate/3-hydroxycinnamic acid hydroxylase MhpA n=1 Tax=Sinomonas atrocyanea TaxID=37927 RepID=UPI003D97FFF3